MKTLINCWWKGKPDTIIKKYQLPLLKIYPNEYIFYYRDTCTSMFTAALFTVAKKWNQPKCPSTHEWVKELYSVVKKNEICREMSRTVKY